MRTIEDFNKKYAKWLETGHYGLDIDEENIVKYLDHHFKSFTKYPNFSYSQIKTKFSSVRFYCVGLPESIVHNIEETIEHYLTIKYHEKF